ncbi:ankyrin repeat domain-containing protein [Streptomyces sp. NPDC056013]|uniref:ankyrin repeat domain-containing protein n=1 Tax=Streptomyces sp. NPDC056013 TaxID=3345680 RepID=UPI0035DCA2EE
MSDYWTPTHFAVEHEDTETLARLLANGADPDEVFSNMTLLTHAIDTEGDGALQSGQPLTVHTTAVLLAFDPDPELIDPGGHTPLERATSYDHDLAVELLRTHISKRAGGGRRAGSWRLAAPTDRTTRTAGSVRGALLRRLTAEASCAMRVRKFPCSTSPCDGCRRRRRPRPGHGTP